MTGAVVYIVDWDIPASPPGLRRRFYRKLAALCLELDPKFLRSTQSVLKTYDRDLAIKVFTLANECGRANIYEGRPLGMSHV